VQVLVKLN